MDDKIFIVITNNSIQQVKRIDIMKVYDNEFLKDLDRVIPMIDDGQNKMEFAKNFMVKKMGVDDLENSRISLHSTSCMTFASLIVSIILEYESELKKSSE